MGLRVFFWSSLWGVTSALRSFTLWLDCRVRAYLQDARMREAWERRRRGEAW